MLKSRDFHIYVFDLIEQSENESFDSFVERLRLQAETCQFPNADQEVKRRIIAKCRSDCVRHQVFNNELTLHQVILTGRNFEKAECHLEKENFPNSKKVKSFCTRCGSNDHRFYNKACPALNERCYFCNNLGHLPAFCFERNIHKNKRQHSPDGQVKPAKCIAIQPALPVEHNSRLREKLPTPELLKTVNTEADSTQVFALKTEIVDVSHEFFGSSWNPEAAIATSSNHMRSLKPLFEYAR